MRYIGLTKSGRDLYAGLKTVLRNTSHPQSRLSHRDFIEYAILDYINEGSHGEIGPHIPLDILQDDMVAMDGLPQVKDDVLKGLIRKGYLEVAELDYYGMDPG